MIGLIIAAASFSLAWSSQNIGFGTALVQPVAAVEPFAVALPTRRPLPVLPGRPGRPLVGRPRRQLSALPHRRPLPVLPHRRPLSALPHMRRSCGPIMLKPQNNHECSWRAVLNVYGCIIDYECEPGMHGEAAGNLPVQDKQNTTEKKPAPGTVYSQSYDMPEKQCSAVVREDRLPTGETVQNMEGRVDGYHPKEDCVEMCFKLEHCSGVVYDPDKKTCIGYNDTAQEYNDTNTASQTKVFLIYSIHCKQIVPPPPINNVTTTLKINCTEMYQNQVYQISFDRSYLEKSDMTLRDYSPGMFFLTKMKWMRKPEMNVTTFHGQCKMNCWMLSLRKMIPKTVNNVLYLMDSCYCLDTVDNNMEDSKNTLAEMETAGLIDNSTAMAIGRNVQCSVVNSTEYITGSAERGIEFKTLKKDQINLMGQ